MRGYYGARVFYTIGEIADALKTKRRDAYRLIREAGLPYFVSDHRVFVDKTPFDEFIKTVADAKKSEKELCSTDVLR